MTCVVVLWLQWLPYDWRYQLGYIIYRWILVVYFFVWLVKAGIAEASPEYFIYLTNWAHISYNTYLIVAAASSTFKLISSHFLTSRRTPNSMDHPSEEEEPDGLWNISRNQLSWYQMVHWVCFSIGNEMAIGVMVLYWTFIYRGDDIDGVNANTHLLNGVLSVVDVWVSGVPVWFLHCVYIMAYGAAYSIFSGLYFIVTGENIYDVLDYKGHTGSAVALYLGVVFLLLPVLHMCVCLMYVGRVWVVSRVCRTWGRHCAHTSRSNPSEQTLELTDVRTWSDSDP